MLKGYTQPWFILYTLSVTVLLVSSVEFGLFSILIAIGPYVLVDLGVWPKSSEWMKISSKFKLRHRVCVGIVYVVIVISYEVFGVESLYVNLIVLGMVLQYVESLIKKDA